MLGETKIPVAMLNGLMHRNVVISLNGDSYRLHENETRIETLRQSIALPCHPSQAAGLHRVTLREFKEHHHCQSSFMNPVLIWVLPAGRTTQRL